MRVTSWCVATLLFATCASGQGVDPAQQKAAAGRFGAEVTRAFNERDRKELVKLLDFRELTTRAARHMDLSGEEARGFMDGVKSVGVNRLIDAYFLTLDSGEGTVKFMRVTDSLPPRSLIRLDLGQHGFNYIEFVLRTDAEGKTRAVDWFQLNTGELMSVTLAEASQMFAASNPGLIERLFGDAKPNAEVLAQLQKINELRRAGKHAESLALLKQLPEPIASSRLMLMARAQSASLANLPKEYDRALEKLAAKYSSDPAALFMLIDYYFTHKDTPQLLKALDTMEKRVGVDGVSCLLRANAHVLSGDYASALKYAEESIRLEPERLPAYDSRATFLVQLARFQDAVDAYRAMEKDFGLTFTRAIFLEDPTFKDLVASKPFRAWLPR